MRIRKRFLFFYKTTFCFRCLTCSGATDQSEEKEEETNEVTDGAKKESGSKSEEDEEEPLCEYAKISVSKVQEFSTQAKQNIHYYSYFFQSSSFYALDCLGPTVPFSRVFALPSNRPLVSLISRKGKSMFSVKTVIIFFQTTLDSNPELRRLLSKTAIPRFKEFEVDLEDKKKGENSSGEQSEEEEEEEEDEEDLGPKARVRLILPPGLREGEEFVFPLVVNT